MVGYWRSSVDSYLRERMKHEKYIRKCQKLIRFIDSNRYYFLNKNIMEHKQVQNFEYLPICMGMCNLSVESFLQLFVVILSSWVISKSMTNMKDIFTILATMVYTMTSSVYMSIVS